jgi:hypothetical protein
MYMYTSKENSLLLAIHHIAPCDFRSCMPACFEILLPRQVGRLIKTDLHHNHYISRSLLRTYFSM